MKKSAHQIWKEAKEQNLSREETKNLLKKEGVIVPIESIEVREFRIGNYVNTKYGNLKVFTINELGVEIQDNSGWIDYINSENLKPIEITEEILLKCGFKKIDHHRFKIIPSEFEFYYTISVHDNCFRIYVGDSITCANVIFYLHQLQNLYFALTNQELEINL